MHRSEFVKTMLILSATPTALKLSQLHKLTDEFPATEKMPVFFIGHGNPMNAILDNSITKGWEQSSKGVPKPKAILVVSAHWETRGTWVTAMENPKTIHDFYGFPKELFDVQYPAPGAPEFAHLVSETVTSTAVSEDHAWGLDHGTWSVLVKMYPEADIPVFQLSLNRAMTPDQHYALAKELAPLRTKGVLIIGSGNIVHNLRLADLSDDKPYDWAAEFDALSKKLIETHAHDKLIAYHDLGTAANLSIPTPEHYLPMLYAVALQGKDEPLQFFNEELVFRSGSMRSLRIG
jgi:4,5-DOPA dioxygenase extradiol